MSTIYELLKKAEESKQPKGDGEGMPVLEIEDLELKETDNLRSSIMGEIPAASKEHTVSNGENVSLSSSCLIQMVQDIKVAISSMVRSSLVGLEKANDADLKKHSKSTIMKDYRKIDLVLRMLLSYIRMSQPMVKKETIHEILEELLTGSERDFQARSIVVTKQYHDQIPETTMHEEELRFILGSVLQYAILTTPVNGEITVITQPIHLHKSPEEEKIVSRKGRYSEVSIRCSHLDEQVGGAGKGPEALSPSQEGGVHSVLLVIRELMQKSQGSFELEIDKKELRKQITLRFPAERRQAVYYKPVQGKVVR